MSRLPIGTPLVDKLAYGPLKTAISALDFSARSMSIHDFEILGRKRPAIRAPDLALGGDVGLTLRIDTLILTKFNLIGSTPNPKPFLII